MAKQQVGEKKLARCRAVTGRPYRTGLVRGGWPHFHVECWYGKNDADIVNWKTGTWEPHVRNGHWLQEPTEPGPGPLPLSDRRPWDPRDNPLFRPDHPLYRKPS